MQNADTLLVIRTVLCPLGYWTQAVRAGCHFANCTQLGSKIHKVLLTHLKTELDFGICVLAPDSNIQPLIQTREVPVPWINCLNHSDPIGWDPSLLPLGKLGPTKIYPPSIYLTKRAKQGQILPSLVPTEVHEVSYEST